MEDVFGSGCFGSIFDQNGCAALVDTSEGSYSVAVQRALEYLPDNETFDWVDPESTHRARVTILETRVDAAGQYCRELAHQVSPAANPSTKAYCREAETGEWVLSETGAS